MALLADWTTSWASIYANHAAIRTLVMFLHVGGLMAGGGIALAADRFVLKVTIDDEYARRTLLDAVGASHRVIVLAIVVILVSGVLMFAADVDTYLHSKVFWLKMALFAMLLVNGTVLAHTGRRVLQDGSGRRTLRATALTSVTLWSLTTLAGVALPNIG